jgi:hypothetical protein
MIEDQIESFPLPNEHKLVWIYIKTELEKAGIEVHQIGIDNTVTTDKEIPEKLLSQLREYAADKGIIAEFKVTRQENSAGRVR